MFKCYLNKFVLLFAFILFSLQIRHGECHLRGLSHHRRAPQWKLPNWWNSFFPNSSPPSQPTPPSPQTPPASAPPASIPINSPALTPQAPTLPTTTGPQNSSTPALQSPPLQNKTASNPSAVNSSFSQPLKPTTGQSNNSASSNVLPSRQAGSACPSLRVRKEWRKFSRQEQINYIQSVKCLAKLPSKLLPGGNYRRYDDFQNVHSRMRNKIHWIASFLPWHRHFLFLYEQALQNECGYSGNLPRWDWSLDSADVTNSPVFSPDPDVGFGSNGMDFSDDSDGLDAGIVQDGAFANWKLYYPDEHFLQRNYNLPQQYRQSGKNWGGQFFDANALAKVQSQGTYAKLAVALEGTDPASSGPSNPGPHSIIHVIIGGDISPTAYAANEPLFYLHHSNVDSLWLKWQNSARSSRLNAYGGQRNRGSGKNDAQLADRLVFLGLSPDISVSQAMDTYAYPYCYRYE